MNHPYVKRIENGVFVNPIQKELITKFPNRSSRRGKKISTQAINGKKNGLTVNGVIKYKKVLQVCFDPITKKRKQILHYLTK